jgi:hypothetical protein
MTTSPVTVGCTIVARNYLPYARVLAESWRRHHEGRPLYALVIDGDDETRNQGLEVVLCEELGLPDAELWRLRGIYDVAELTSAVKPHLLRLLLDRGADAVIFIDSDTEVHADLGEVARAAADHGVALTTHVLEPPPLDGMSPSEIEIAWSGLFNTGFIAVGRPGRACLDWWASRLRRDCLFHEPMGVHADQRWLDFVPSYFEHTIIRDPGVNVAHWNVHERPIRWQDGRFTAAGRPLRAFHFSGFDIDDPERPGPDGWPAPLRFDVGAEPDLRRLCRSYADRLLAAGYREARRIPYRWATTAAGRTLSRWDRRAYREVLLAAEARGIDDVPGPFDPARSAEFERMLADPTAGGLLSGAAAARLGDARLARPATNGDRWDPARTALALARQLPRRLPMRRHPWMPHPIASDRTRREYAP